MNKKTRTLTEIAISIAMAVICSFICVYKMPQGGSVALTMLPILLISFRKGFVSGIFAGGIYGLISLLIEGVIYHPASVVLDYILAFGFLGVAGLFRPSKSGILLGSASAVFCRFLCSYISGVTIFASYAPEGQSVWIYSLVYQLTYLLPELIISCVVLLLLKIKAPALFIRQ